MRKRQLRVIAVKPNGVRDLTIRLLRSHPLLAKSLILYGATVGTGFALLTAATVLSDDSVRRAHCLVQLYHHAVSKSAPISDYCPANKRFEDGNEENENQPAEAVQELGSPGVAEDGSSSPLLPRRTHFGTHSGTSVYP